MNIGTLISMTIGYTPTPAWLIVPFLATMHPLSYWAVPLLADRARGLLQTGPLLPLLGLEKAPDVTVAWAAVAVAFVMTYVRREDVKTLLLPALLLRLLLPPPLRPSRYPSCSHYYCSYCHYYYSCNELTPPFSLSGTPAFTRACWRRP